MTTNSILSTDGRIYIDTNGSIGHAQTNGNATKRYTWDGTFVNIAAMNLFDCLQFIIVHGMFGLNDNNARDLLNELCKPLFMNNIIDDERLLLQKLANNFVLNFKVWVIDNRGSYSYLLTPLTEKKLEHQYLAFMVFQKDNLTWYPLHALDSNKEVHTAFPHNNQYIDRMQEEFGQFFVRFNASENTQQLSVQSQDQASTNADYQMDWQIMNESPIQQVYEPTTNPKPPQIPPSATKVHINCETTPINIARSILQKTLVGPEQRAPTHFLSNTTGVVQTTTTMNNPNETVDLPAPKLLYQPKRLWHYRYFSEGVSKPLPTFATLQFNVEGMSEERVDELYIGVDVVTYDNTEHEEKFVAPAGAGVDRSYENPSEKSKCFVLGPKNPAEFDENKCVLSKLSLIVKKGMKISIVKRCQSQKISKRLIKDGKLKWFKFRFAYYTKVSAGIFHRVSPVSYSDLILETGKGQSAKNPQLTLRSLCEKGGQVIPVVINETIEQKDLCVWMNNQYLERNQFKVERNAVSFVSPAGVAGNDLHIVIVKRNGHFLEERKMTYQPHGDHKEPCDAYKD